MMSQKLLVIARAVSLQIKATHSTPDIQRTLYLWRSCVDSEINGFIIISYEFNLRENFSYELNNVHCFGFDCIALYCIASN